jgi:hypothetical protein
MKRDPDGKNSLNPLNLSSWLLARIVMLRVGIIWLLTFE